MKDTDNKRQKQAGGGKDGNGEPTGELSDWDSESDEGATSAAVVQKGKGKGGFSMT